MNILPLRNGVIRAHARNKAFAAKATLGTRFDAVPSSSLRLFLDSASVKQWEQWNGTGIFYGYTTNPTILERDGVQCNVKSLTKLAAHALGMGVREIHMQAWGDSVQKLSSVAFDLAGIDPKHVVVKLPCTLEGTQTAALLKAANIRVTMTGLASSMQVLPALATGAEYAAPYLGRMNDRMGGNKGMEAVMQMQDIIKASGSDMRLMVASIREPSELASLSAHVRIRWYCEGLECV